MYMDGASSPICVLFTQQRLLAILQSGSCKVGKLLNKADSSS